MGKHGLSHHRSSGINREAHFGYLKVCFMLQIQINVYDSAANANA